MNKKIKVNDIMAQYMNGTAGVEETNAKLKAVGAGFTLNPYKNAITPEEAASGDERNGFGMLDTGTGSLDKVEIREMKLLHSVGEMTAFVKFNGKLYKVAADGVTLEESGVDA